MHDGLLGFLKQVGTLLRVLKLLLTPKKISHDQNTIITSDIPPELCSDGVGGWRYYFYVGYKSSRVATFSSEC